MDRSLINAQIEAFSDPEFRSELAHHLSIEEREYAYDAISALYDIEDRAETGLRERPSVEEAKTLRRLLRIAREALIGIGVYRAMTEEDIANTYSSSGSKWAFRLNGTAYERADDAVDQFPEDEA